MAWRNWFVSSLLLLCWACGRQMHSGNGEMVGGYGGEVAANGKGVAAYYSRHVEDSLKWKAACFLLQNMEGHGNGGTGKDCEVLDSSWLVNHIERVFLLRDSCPWLEGMCFQTFLNYLLPYRVADEDIAEMEVLDTNRERRYAYALAYYDDCRKSASQLELFLSGEGLTRNRKQYADAVKEVAWLRAHGVPSAVDFIPVSTGSENAWVWVADDRLQPQLPAYVQRERVGKVYRSVFARQPIPDAGEEYVPAFFRNPFYLDVTAIYFEGKTVELALPDSLTAKYVYLAMPAGKDWQVVAWSETEGHSCRFEHVGSGNVYLPVYYPDSLPVACGLPFVVKDDGSLTFLHGEGITDVSVMRMEPYYSTTDRLNNYFPGSRFESANDRAFQKDSCAYKIPCHPHYAWGSIRMDTIQERRYWRHVGKPAFSFHLAELYFLDEKGNVLSGRFWGPDSVGVVADGNPDTYKSYKGWLGVDFGCPVRVAEIRYLLAGDGGEVREGRRYQLSCWVDNRWVVVDSRMAHGRKVVFEGVSAGCLYRLAEEGQDGRTCFFTWEGNRIRYW